MATCKILVSLLTTLVAISACGEDPKDPGGVDAGNGGTPPGTGGRASGGKAPTPSSGGTNGSGGSSSGGGSSGGGGTATGGDDGDTGGSASTGGLPGSGGESTGGAGPGTGGTDNDAGADASTDGGSGTDSGLPDGGSEGGSEGGSVPREFVYVSARFNGGGVSTAAIDLTNGELQVLPNAPVATRGAVAVSVHSSQKFVFVALENKRIETYRIAADGSLPAAPASSIDLPDTIATLALDPRGRFAYAPAVIDFDDLSRPRAVHTLRIDANTGALTADENPLRVGTEDDFVSAAFVAVDPSGTFAYVSMNGEIGLHGYRVDQTSGNLTELADSPFSDAVLPDGAGVLAGAIVIKPSGDFLYTAGAALNAFAIDRTSGKLTLVTGSPFSREIQSDPSATNLAMEARGRWLYATKFSAFNGPQSISGFRINPASGALTPLPNSPIRDVTSSPYSIAVNPSGTLALVGQDFGKVSVFLLDPTGSFLREAEGSPFTLGGLEPKIAFATLR